MDITGAWIGEYHFDPENFSFPASFTLWLNQGWSGRVSGTVRDGEGGMPEEGRIVGWIRGRDLRFQKLMPVARVAAGKESRTLAEHVARLGGFTIPRDVAHPPICYTGELSEDGRLVAGRWSVRACILPLRDREGREGAVILHAYSGTWSAIRADESYRTIA